jgi:Flp pilus assembly protein protease CpaA
VAVVSQTDSSLVAVSQEAGETTPFPSSASHKLPWLSTWIILISLSALAASLLVFLTHAAHGFFVGALACFFCIIAALFDGFTARIPNQLTYTAFVLGLAINLLAAGLAQVPVHSAMLWLAAPGLFQCLLAIGVCVPLALIGLLMGIGGGDLKLLLALGALVGLEQLGYIMLISLTLAGVYALINLLIAGRLNRVVRVASLHALEIVFLRRMPPPLINGLSDILPGSRVPMAVPLAIGVIVAQCLTLQMVFGGGL